MAEASAKAIKAALEAIRERAESALKQIQESEEKRSMRWNCKDCRYLKHFTKPVPLEAAREDVPDVKVLRLKVSSRKSGYSRFVAQIRARFQAVRFVTGELFRSRALQSAKSDKILAMLLKTYAVS